jgi:hypothetical protein
MSDLLWRVTLAVAGALVAFSAWAAFFRWKQRLAARAHARFTATDVEAALCAILGPDYHGNFDEFLIWPIDDPPSNLFAKSA